MNRKDEIRKLRSEGLSYQKISDQLGVDRNYAWRVCTGKENGHPRARLRDVPDALTDIELRAKTGTIITGCVSEMMVAIKLVEMGFDVWKPFIERQRSDLAIAYKGRISRIQVKTASYDAEGKRFRASLGTKDGRRRHVSYVTGDFEFFIIRCAGLEVHYVLPFVIGAQHGYVNLYPNREQLLDRGHPFEKYQNAFHLLRGED